MKNIHFVNIQLSKQELEAITNAFEPITINKNEFLLHEGEVCKNLYYIKKGSIRTFFLDKNGAEKTSSVCVENHFGTAWTSFISQLPSDEFIDAIENSEILVVSHQEFYKRTRNDILWKELYIKLMELAYLNQSRKIEALMTLSATQRFQKLFNANPAMIQKLSNKTLASFLHMREETLSRLKSK